MKKVIITDFSKVLLYAKNKDIKKLNEFHEENLEKLGENYDFWDYFVLDKKLLKFYKKLSEKNKVYIFTTKYIQEYPAVKKELEGIFEKVFIAKDMDVKKDNENSYHKIALKLGLEEKKIIYIDDNKNNFEASQKTECQSILYKNFNNQFKEKIKKNICEESIKK